jgi:pyridinium-3,5-bisthiocarboxylic acid mononucleotide nickel chelatase
VAGMDTAWIDASAGVAGDMLLGALLDAGADLGAVRAAVAAVVPGEVAVSTGMVHRAGLRALRAEVVGAEVAGAVETHPHRTWRQVRGLLQAADLAADVRGVALAAFTLLADAEARVHGIDAEDVAFHEVGAWDSIADIVGVAAALADLGVRQVTAGPVALGSGRVATAHGDLPVPAPAVLELSRGWRVLPGGDGELATPTGMALVRALARECGPLPPMTVTTVGIGAGGRDVPGRANVTRVVLGAALDRGDTTSTMWQLETNVDDLDPRVWPTVLAALLDAGAADAWLVPIVMKKGRPAHTLCVLAHAADRAPLRDAVFALTGTLGVREAPVHRIALDRDQRLVPVTGGAVRVKAALRGGRVVRATPEFDDAARIAAERGLPVRHVLDEAAAAAAASGLRPGAAWDGGPQDDAPQDDDPLIVRRQSGPNSDR